MVKKKTKIKKNNAKSVSHAKHARISPILNLEFNRQLLHILVGLGCIAVLSWAGLSVLQNFLLGLLVAGIILSVLIRAGHLSGLKKLLPLVERTKEGVPGQGAIIFIVGIAVTSFVFSQPLPVLVGLVCLTFQDSFSALFGTRFGKTTIFRNKTLEGSIGGFVACFLALLTILPVFPALVVALVATIVEILPIDDAFSIPFLSAALVHFWV